MKTKYLILSILLIAMSYNMHSQIISFPDVNFKNALLNHDPVIDTNNDGEIQVSEAEIFTEQVNVYNNNITDLTGIEYFINIIELNCSQNLLTQLDVSQMSLLFLNCQNNSLTNLEVSNTSIWWLWCDNNQLTDLDITTIEELQVLLCSNNLLTNLDVSQSTNLVTFDCSYNQLSNLNTSANTSLDYLDCSSNSLISLDLSNNNGLYNLNFSYNALTEIDINNKTLLHSLKVNDNSLTELDISNNSDLIGTLDISNNQISEIDIFNTNIDELKCSNNLLTNLNTMTIGNGELQSLECSGNLFTELNLSDSEIYKLKCDNNPNLESINIRNGWNSEFDYSVSEFENLPNLSSVCLDHDNTITLVNFILDEVQHNVDFFNNESCDEFVLSINENELDQGFILYPNPTNGLLMVDSSLNIEQVEFYNNTGKLVLLFTKTGMLDISNLVPGIYFTKVIDVHGNYKILKIIKV